MSVKAMAWVFEHSPYALGGRLVHLVLADIANEENDWQVWASQSYIAQKANLARSTVAATIKTMVADGVLEIVQEAPPGGRATYRMIWPGGVSKSDTPCPNDSAEPVRSTETHLFPTKGGQPNQTLRAEDPLQRTAWELTVLAFEQPVIPELRDGGKGAFPAALGIIERVLRAGTPVDQVRTAITTGVTVWTLAGLQTAIAQSRPRERPDPRRGRPGTSLRDLQSDYLHSREGRLELDATNQ